MPSSPAAVALEAVAQRVWEALAGGGGAPEPGGLFDRFRKLWPDPR